MVRTVSIEELKQHTDELFDDIARCGGPVLVEAHGAARGVVMSVAEYERIVGLRDAAWQRGWEAVDRLRERNADQDPFDIDRLVTDVVEEVRQEMYDAGRHGDSGSR